LLSERFNFAGAHRFLTKINGPHLSKSQFYRIQQLLVPKFHFQAQKSYKQAFAKLERWDCLPFDGAENYMPRMTQK
jgi:hypothetical protein